MNKKAKLIIIFFVIILILAITRCESKTTVGGEINFEPIKARIRHKDDHFIKDQVITVYIDYFGYSKSLTEDYGIKSAKIEVVTDDLFSIKGKGEYNYSKLKEINKKTFSFKLQKTSDVNRDGVIAVKLHMYKEDGEHWGTKTKELYYLTSGEDVYIGEDIGNLKVKFYEQQYLEETVDSKQHGLSKGKISNFSGSIYMLDENTPMPNKQENSITGAYGFYDGQGSTGIWLYEGDRIYFSLQLQAEKGDIFFVVNDYRDNIIAKLSKENPSISLEIKKTGPYYLKIEWDNYLGDFDLKWEITK